MESRVLRSALGIAVAGVIALATLSPAAAYHRYRHHHWRGHDSVGSIHSGGRYGYNRVSGRPFHKCMEDLGYGRTEPCDGGNR
jgi:hypothetical protein